MQQQPPSIETATDEPTQVIIVGGGCAGIAAARLLFEHNIQAVLVEAKPCIGGRVCAGRPMTQNRCAHRDGPTPMDGG